MQEGNDTLIATRKTSPLLWVILTLLVLPLMVSARGQQPEEAQRELTGWDIADYRGPLTWEQEEKQRAEVQKIHWHDNIEDLVVRYRPKPPKK